MYRAQGGPKRYVVIDDAEGLVSRQVRAGRGGHAGRMQCGGYATVENLQAAVGGVRSAGAGFIIPPIPRNNDILRPPIQREARPAAGGARLWVILAVIAACAILLGGGGWLMLAGSGAPARSKQQAVLAPSGDSLSLPRDCVLSKLGVTKDVPFVRFDGQYPEQWPAGMRLPDGFFNQGQGKLSAGLARPGDEHYADVQRIEFNGVVHTTPDELVAFFRTALGEAGLELTGDHRSIGKDLRDVGYDPGRITLTAKPRGSSGTYPTFFVKVALLDDMGGWAYCTGHWIFGSYQVRQGERMHRVPRDAKIVDENGVEVGNAADAGGSLPD